MIFYFFKTFFKLKNKNLLNRWILSLIKNENVILGEINYIYCNDQYLLFINNKYLNHDFYTDIITFNHIKDIKIYGDIFISIDRIKENALKCGSSFEKELYRIMVHGILHLISYQDKIYSDRNLMRKKESFYLDLFFLKLKEKCFMML